MAQSNTVCKGWGRFHSIIREICHLLAFCWSSLLSALYAFIKCVRLLQHWGLYPYSIGTNFVHHHSLSLMLDPLVKKWSMISLVTWEHLGRIIGCLTSNGKVEFSSLPPTLISPWSSMKGFNLNRGFAQWAWVSAPYDWGLQFHSWMLIVGTP